MSGDNGAARVRIAEAIEATFSRLNTQIYHSTGRSMAEIVAASAPYELAVKEALRGVDLPEPLRDMETRLSISHAAMGAAVGEMLRLQHLVAGAPHDEHCEVGEPDPRAYDEYVTVQPTLPCTCWKRDALPRTSERDR